MYSINRFIERRLRKYPNVAFAKILPVLREFYPNVAPCKLREAAHEPRRRRYLVAKGKARAARRRHRNVFEQHVKYIPGWDKLHVTKGWRKS